MPATRSIETLRDALSDPTVYPHEPEQVTLEQTHISLVAIVPPWVYKVKKPVELGFLDFSTLERRRHFCEEEVRLNRRLCEGTYQGVVPIVDTPEGLRVNPTDDRGEAVEYAVKMRYLDPACFLDARVTRGEATEADVDRVVDTLRSFYTSRPSTPEVAAAGWIENLRVSTEENFDQTADQVGSALTRTAYDALRYYTDRFFDQHAALFHRRRAGGFIVDGHGDLRLEHVHLTDERVCIYDCIEFNERFRHLDVAEDVAFLAMDLDYHGRTDLARHLVARVERHWTIPTSTTSSTSTNATAPTSAARWRACGPWKTRSRPPSRAAVGAGRIGTTSGHSGTRWRARGRWSSLCSGGRGRARARRRRRWPTPSAGRTCRRTACGRHERASPSPSAPTRPRENGSTAPR
jgi:Uncharacterized protein conserved in bacteria